MSNSFTLQGFLVELLTFAEFGVLYEDEHGRIKYTNPKLHEILEISVPPQAIEGLVCMDLAIQSKDYWAHPDEFIGRIVELYATNEVVRNESLTSATGKVLLRDLIPVRFDEKDHGRLWLYKDVTQQTKSEHDLIASKFQLSGITETLLQYINSGDSRKSLPILLDHILELTGSEYGFIGEILYDEQENPYLKSHAITDIAWNDQTREYYKTYVDEGLEFRNLKTLFGHTLTTHEVIISNDPINDPRGGGIPHGHPAMNSYIGIPFFKNEQIMGMIGLANKPAGYSIDVVEQVKPFLVTASSVIQNFRQEVDRKRIQIEVIEREQRWRLAIEGTLEGIWDLNFSNMEMFCSDYCKSLFNRNECEFAGFDTILNMVDSKDKFSILRIYVGLKNGSIDDYILNGEIRLPVSDGGSKWLQWRCAILRDEDNTIKRLTGSLIDITKKKIVEEEIKIALHKQENLNQLRQRFVTMASHEFKSPLTSIQTSSDLIEMVLDKEGYDIVPKISKYTNRIRQQVKRLNNILSDILVLGRLEANQLQLKREWVSITTLVTDVQEHLSHLIEDGRNLVFENSVSSDRMYADINLMMHLLSNLISNAYKYSEDRPAPAVRFSTIGDFIQIEVEDFGIGMDEKDLNNMFQPFYRSDKVEGVKGYGLGLVLVKEIIDVHSGTVEVRSEIDKGTTVWVRIPQPKGL
jgi:signal transduction histidine kinase